MAYQPIPRPVTGNVSVISMGADSISLASAGVRYVAMAVRLIQGLPNGYSIITETADVMTTNQKQVEWAFVANPVVTGDPLVFTDLGAPSVLQGAIGNGTQIATGGFPTATGGYVSGTGVGRVRNPLVTTANPLTPLPDSLIGYVIVTPLSNNASVVVRAAFLEVLLDDGSPLPPAAQSTPAAPPAEITIEGGIDPGVGST